MRGHKICKYVIIIIFLISQNRRQVSCFNFKLDFGRNYKFRANWYAPRPNEEVDSFETSDVPVESSQETKEVKDLMRKNPFLHRSFPNTKIDPTKEDCGTLSEKKNENSICPSKPGLTKPCYINNRKSFQDWFNPKVACSSRDCCLIGKVCYQPQKLAIGKIQETETKELVTLDEVVEQPAAEIQKENWKPWSDWSLCISDKSQPNYCFQIKTQFCKSLEVCGTEFMRYEQRNCSCSSTGNQEKEVEAEKMSISTPEKPKVPILSSFGLNNHCLPSSCGQNAANSAQNQRVKKIVGGLSASEKSWPWMVGLKKYEENNKEYLCGATLICPKFVISAAHCLEHRQYYKPELDLNVVDYQLFFGYHYNPALEQSIIYPQMQKRSGKHNHLVKITPHPLFEAKKPKNIKLYVEKPPTEDERKTFLQLHDLAIFELKDAILLTKTVSPICLLPQNNVVLPPPNLVWAAGWGMTKDLGPNNLKLKYVAQRVIPPSICKKRSKWYNFEPEVFCSGGEYGQDTCQGDSGGPVIQISKNDRKYYLAGVVSTGSKSCNSLKYDVQPAVTLNVTFYMDWILETTRGCC